MPIIITLAHQKGGVGKSTLASNLWGYFSRDYKTALVDIDPQGSLSNLVETYSSSDDGRSREHLITRRSFKSYQELREKLDSYDIAIIDTPPYLSNELLYALEITNLVLVPCKTSPLDCLAIGGTLDLILQAKEKTPKLLAAIVLTMTIAGTEMTKNTRLFLEETHDFPVLKTEIGNRVAYMRSLFYANTVLGDENSKAVDEINRLGHEIYSLMENANG